MSNEIKIWLDDIFISKMSKVDFTVSAEMFCVLFNTIAQEQQLDWRAKARLDDNMMSWTFLLCLTVNMTRHTGSVGERKRNKGLWTDSNQRCCHHVVNDFRLQSHHDISGLEHFGRLHSCCHFSQSIFLLVSVFVWTSWPDVRFSDCLGILFADVQSKQFNCFPFQKSETHKSDLNPTITPIFFVAGS